MHGSLPFFLNKNELATARLQEGLPVQGTALVAVSATKHQKSHKEVEAPLNPPSLSLAHPARDEQEPQWRSV